jgi:hypothetical protein
VFPWGWKPIPVLKMWRLWRYCLFRAVVTDDDRNHMKIFEEWPEACSVIGLISDAVSCHNQSWMTEFILLFLLRSHMFCPKEVSALSTHSDNNDQLSIHQLGTMTSFFIRILTFVLIRRNESCDLMKAKITNYTTAYCLFGIDRHEVHVSWCSSLDVILYRHFRSWSRHTQGAQ